MAPSNDGNDPDTSYPGKASPSYRDIPKAEVGILDIVVTPQSFLGTSVGVKIALFGQGKSVDCSGSGFVMSSRALRKAQREREEQDRLEKLTQEAAELEEEEDDDDAPAPAAKSAFAMLQEDDDDDDGGTALDEDDGQHEDAASSIPPSAATTAGSKSKNNKKKKKKKAKATAEEGLPGVDEDMDEIDQALKQLSANGQADQAGTTNAGVDQKLDETSRLLAIDTNHLHAQNEMRRLFGRAALEQRDDDEEDPAPQNVGGNRRQQRRVQQVGLAQALRGQGGAGGRAGGLSAMALRRNIFIQGKEDWPIATGGGLAMEVEEKRCAKPVRNVRREYGSEPSGHATTAQSVSHLDIASGERDCETGSILRKEKQGWTLEDQRTGNSGSLPGAKTPV
ncbi:hypothetical protein KC347_g288 [Hortaea werneckii]|nr:hypothetical protein KC347_g288 [Hortaea werneckii]